MKYTAIFILLLASYKVYCQGKFVITGTVSSEFNTQKIYLSIRDSYSMNRYEISDTTLIKNNQFIFTGNLDKPCEWAQIYTRSGFYYFALDTGLNIITINPLPKNSPTYKNKLSNSKVQNSASNRVYRSLYELFSNYYLKYGKPSVENKGVLELDKGRKQEIHNKEIDILLNNADVYYSLIHLYEMFNRLNKNIIEIESLYLKLSKELKTSPLGQELNQKVQESKKLLIGQKAPLFEISTQSDSIFLSSSLAGKVYLIAFGATWCMPCKKNYPLLRSIYQKNRNKDFEIVSVNLDADKKKWNEQIFSYNLSWINVSELVEWDKSQISKLFDVRALPFYLIIDKNGVIVYNSFQINDIEGSQLEVFVDKAVN